MDEKINVIGTTKYSLAATLTIILALTSGIFAQDSLWSANFGGYYNETGYAATRLSNGDILLLGSTYSYGSGDHDIYLVKTDSTGTELWSQTYGGTSTDYGYDITPTADGGFVIIGSTTSYGSGGHDVYLLKINASGTRLWSATYGGAQDDIGTSIRMTSDSGFIICGTTDSYGTGTDIYLIKTDSLGDSLWTRTYGGASGESGAAVRTGSDSGYVLIGSTGSYGAGYSSIYLIRTGDTGDTLWTATYGGSRADFGHSIETTNDKGFILAGTTAPDGENFYDAYLIKTDSFGVVQWDSTYGGAYEDRAYSVKATTDGGYIMTGMTEAGGGRGIDIFMVKTDPAGATEWSRAYGGDESDFGRTVFLDSQGDYFVAGHSYSSSSGGSDIYLLKARGPIQSPVDWDQAALPSDIPILSQNYPNPFNPDTRIMFKLPRSSAYELTVYNVLGQIVRRWDAPSAFSGWHTIIWDGTDDYGEKVVSGIYFYRLTTRDFTQSKKMVLLK